MTWMLRAFAVVYSLISLLFASAGVFLVFIGTRSLWLALRAAERQSAEVVDAIGTLAVALVALEIAQTIIEEEVVRRAQVSAPTRVRRYLSRFFVVVAVALSIKYLVAVVRHVDDKPEYLWTASSIGFATAALLLSWGVFLRLNRSAEELEPEAMGEAKKEDAKVQ